MNQKQEMILELLEEELNVEYNKEIIDCLLSNKANFFSMPRGFGKTSHIIAAAIIVSLTETGNKIKIYACNHMQVNNYNYRIFNILEQLDIKNYNFISNNSYSIYNIKNNKIEIETKINDSTYIEKSDYIFIDELYTIEYKTKDTVRKLLRQSNVSINIFTTLPPRCKKILKLFYKFNFKFKFIKRQYNDIPKECMVYTSEDFFKSEFLGKVIP